MMDKMHRGRFTFQNSNSLNFSKIGKADTLVMLSLLQVVMISLPSLYTDEALGAPFLS